MITKVPTCITGLDEVTGGGLPMPGAIGLIGEAGSGKSLLARQISWNLLKQGFNVLYYSVDESADDVRNLMKDFDWDITRYEEEGRFTFIDIFSIGAEVLKTHADASIKEYIEQVYDFPKLLKEGQDLCLRKMAGKNLLIIIDSINPMLTLIDAKKTFQFLQTMKFITRASRSIGIAIMELGIHDPKIEESCKQIADTIIEVRRVGEGHNIMKYIRISKSPEEFEDEPYLFEIEKNGIIIHRLTIPYIGNILTE